MRDSEDIREESALKLPHPVRVDLGLGGDGLQRLFANMPKETARFLDELFRSPRSLPQVQTEILQNPRSGLLRQMMDMVNAGPAATGTGGSAPMFAAMRQLRVPAPAFQLTDSLVELLVNTDIAEDVPASYLKLPYSRLFLEFGTARTVPVHVPNTVSGLHVLESAYLEFANDPRMGRHLSVMFVGSPVGHNHIGDDATLNIALPMEDPDRPLSECVDWAFEMMVEASRAAGYNVPPREWIDTQRALMSLLLKSLLYIGLPDVRRELKSDRADLLAAMSRLKSSGKRAKLERKLAKTRDLIIIDAPAPREPASSGEETSRTVRAHWRRGHLRLQRHGPQLTMTKMVFIAPALVGRSGDVAPAPSYKVQ